jgi:hypothetical protein
MFNAAQLDQVDHEQLAVIETGAGDRTHRTTIWAVVDDGEVFVRSVRGARGQWYQRALVDPGVRLHVGNESLNANAVLSNDPASIERVSEALRRKYRKGASLDSMLRPEVLPTTLRLEPRD